MGYSRCTRDGTPSSISQLSRDRIREVPPLLIIDRAVQEGYKERRPKLITRKNDRVLTLRLPSDVVDAIRWHIGEGYAGPEFLFSQDGTWPQKVNDHEGPLRDVQKALGLKVLSHHKIGRHSVASQAATGGQPIKTIQAQLGHRSSRSTDRYAHLSSGAQLRLVQSLEPQAPPHQDRHVPLTSPGSHGRKR
ncbi:MAG: tyrosine-type recombinase/integrase [Deltaproteobacteria bacterium]|nr:tyrosine-type recombinase/integrase [Deltaproteobacteria bacterium]